MSENSFNFPQMIQSFIDAVAQQNPSISEEREEARQQLLKKLKGIVGEMPSEEEEEKAKEQVKNLMDNQVGGQLFSILSKLNTDSK